MVDSTRDVTTEQTVAPNLTGQDKYSTAASKVQSTPETFMEHQKAMLAEYSNRIKNLQDDLKERKDAMDAMLQRLQEAINEKNLVKLQEIEKMKAILAIQEKLIQDIGDNPTLGVHMLAGIEVLRRNIDQLEVEILGN